jgi:hypothetical protein
MNRLAILFLGGALALTVADAGAQSDVRVRGVISAYDGKVLSVKSRDGSDLKIALTEKTTVTAFRTLSLADIKPGMGVGAGAVRREDGALVAREVQVFAPERGVPNEGHRPWDMEPGSTMTNAAVSAVVQSTGGREMTLTYKGGSQRLIVPEGVPVITAAPGNRGMLVPGEHVFLVAQAGADGALTALRIQLRGGGIKPPQ